MVVVQWRWSGDNNDSKNDDGNDGDKSFGNNSGSDGGYHNSYGSFIMRLMMSWCLIGNVNIYSH